MAAVGCSSRRAGSTFALLLAVASTSLIHVAYSWIGTGSGFPYYDTCIKDLTQTRFNIVLANQTVNPDLGSTFCFVVNVKPASQCYSPTTRCCGTYYSKVKLYINPACRYAFKPLIVVAPLQKFTATVGYTWDPVAGAQANTTVMKFTQFGPVEQATADGSSFCVSMQPASRSNSVCQTLQGVTNPVDAPQHLFEMAVYDHKVDGYECCPVFTFPTDIGANQPAAPQLGPVPVVASPPPPPPPRPPPPPNKKPPPPPPPSYPPPLASPPMASPPMASPISSTMPPKAAAPPHPKPPSPKKPTPPKPPPAKGGPKPVVKKPPSPSPMQATLGGHAPADGLMWQLAAMATVAWPIFGAPCGCFYILCIDAV